MVTLLKTSYPICISGLISKMAAMGLPETFHQKSGPCETEGRVFRPTYLKVSSVWTHCKTHFCLKDAPVRFSCPSSNGQPADHMDAQPDFERVFHNGIMLPGSQIKWAWLDGWRVWEGEGACCIFCSSCLAGSLAKGLIHSFIYSRNYPIFR